MNQKDLNRCSECGGKCCLIYLEENIPNSLWFEEWVTQFHEQDAEYGVEALFEPLEAHACDRKDLRDELQAKGIDINRCQYCGPKGCLIPREKRPVKCTEYRCMDWIADDSRRI